MTQTGFDWNADVALPVSGKTPLARHCSATGAQAAAVTQGSKLAKLLALFATKDRLTLAECAAQMDPPIQCHALCSTWNRAKYTLNWIEETGDVKRVAIREKKRQRKNGPREQVYSEQAYHRITQSGRQTAFDLLKVRVAQIEARS